jgi:hypothetical protein
MPIAGGFAMHEVTLAALVVAAAACVFAAGRMARAKGLPPGSWMWWAALLGPLPLLVLALVPARRGAAA